MDDDAAGFDLPLAHRFHRRLGDDEFQPRRRHAGMQALGGQLRQTAQLEARLLAALELEKLGMACHRGLGLLLDLGQAGDRQPVQLLLVGEVARQPG